MSNRPPPDGEILGLSAVTLATRDMARAVRFYRGMGFPLRHGGETATFTSFQMGNTFLNLTAEAGLAPGRWGRVVVRVADPDAVHARARALGYTPDTAPADAPWRERYFHMRDPDGHELSFASPLAGFPTA